jgi:hypothetical protein
MVGSSFMLLLRTRLERVKRPVTYAGEALRSTPVKNLFWRYI